MRLTKFTDFGFRALILLAERSPEILSAVAIADQFGVSRDHMAKVLQTLAKAGYVDGIRGVHGGVRLLGDPRDIRIGDLVRTLERRTFLDRFEAENSSCAFFPHRRLKRMFTVAQQGFLRELDNFTLSDCLEKSDPQFQSPN